MTRANEALAVLVLCGRVTAVEAAELMGCTANRATTVLARLWAKGWAERTLGPRPQGRGRAPMVYRPTVAGRARLREVAGDGGAGET